MVHSKWWAWLFIGSLVLLTALARISDGVGQTLLGLDERTSSWLHVGIGAVFGLLYATLGLSVVPLIIQLLVKANARLGNTDHPFAAWLSKYDENIVWTLWPAWLSGCLVAAPMLWLRLFDPPL